MSTRYHFCVNVEHMANISKKQFNREWKNVLSDDAGKILTHEEVVAFFKKELQLGHKVYPMGKCDNFDYQQGCNGHEVTE